MNDSLPAPDTSILRNSTEESERRFRAFALATSDSIYRMSPDWTTMYALEGKGVLSNVGEPGDRWIDLYIHPADRERVRNAVDVAISNRSVFELEHRVLLPDGTLGWTFSRAVPIFNEDNSEVIEWFGAASDITARKKVESELQETRDALEASKRLYEAIIDSTPDLIYVFDLNYRFIYANKALLDMWGKTQEEAFERGLRELGYEEWHEEMHEREIDQVVENKQLIRGEVSFPHATLGRRIYDYIFAPVFNDNGHVVAVAGTTRDISELKSAETALQQSEEQFRILTQSLPQLIWMTDKEGKCKFFNSKWYQYTGSKHDSSATQECFKYCHPDQLAEIRGKWMHSVATKTPFAVECLLKKNDGSYNWFYATANPVQDEDGNVLNWVGAFTNIDEQKAIEEKLEQTVTERTMALLRSNDDLLQFAHVASHDLKEPIRKVRTFASRLEEELGEQIDTRARTSLKKIYSATDRMNSMIEGVLAYSTVSNDQEQFSDVSLSEVITNIRTDLEVAIEQKNAQIIFGDLPHVYGVHVHVYQLFYNIINNSLKFGHRDRSPVITIEAKEVTRDNDKRYTEIAISDNGIGFPNHHATKIFNTFTRLNSKDLYEGTGLGLALCKKIIERHGGTISATGIEGEGATFLLHWPRSTPELSTA